MSKEKIVTTINNEELPITQCRRFESLYYKIGDINVENSGECYFVSNKYYRFETGQIVWDYEKQQYVLKNDNLINGIVKLNESDIQLGYFTKSEDNIPTITPNGTYMSLNEEVFKDSKLYRERLSNGQYYHIDLLSAKEFNRLKITDQGYKQSLPYDSKGILGQYLEKYNKLEVEPGYYINNYSKLIDNLSFGLEFETSSGFIPNRLLNKVGLIPLRDGSITGIEYVTVPMQGSKGLQTVINAVDLLKKRTEYNDSCSLHLHIGNIPRTKEFILAFFKVTCALQDEIFNMFPIYKKYNFGVKNKNYSRPYPTYELLSQMDPIITRNNLDSNFDVLFKYLSMDLMNLNSIGNDLDNIEGHPADLQGNQKWNIKTRYYHSNLIPLIFCNKATIEFRVHTSTFDVNKIIPFIFLNSFLVNYTIHNQEEILANPRFLIKKTLQHVIGHCTNVNDNIKDLGLLRDCLNMYVNERTVFTRSQNANGKIMGEEHLIPSCSSYINWNTKDLKPKGYGLDADLQAYIQRTKAQMNYDPTVNVKKPPLKAKPQPKQQNINAEDPLPW